MTERPPINIGVVVGNTSPQEFRFNLKRLGAKLGDLVTVDISIPSDDENKDGVNVTVWGRITNLQRFNPFLPAEAGVELADEEGVDLLDTVLSSSKDQIEGRVLVLGRTTPGNARKIQPLNYPVQPGKTVCLPPPSSVGAILLGEDPGVHRIPIGTLIGRKDVTVSLKTNVMVARHMALLAMTGGGKTVAARRILRELLDLGYPLVILDPHGDYLGFWEKRSLFPQNRINLYYPHLSVNDNNKEIVGFLISRMTQGFTEAQMDVFGQALNQTNVRVDDTIEINTFIEKLVANVPDARHPGTKPAVLRGLRLVQRSLLAMNLSNEALRKRLSEFPFEPMPDPCTAPHKFVAPGQASIVYLGGYDHLTQSTIVALVLKQLFEERATMRNTIPPFLTVVEEAHNFIPSRGEGQAETPSVEIIRKVVTEGRKFGTGLLLISQRPSRLDETTLSQCNTFLVFRLVNPRDQSFVQKVMENLSEADSRLLPSFGPGQGIVSGQAVRFPLVVSVKHDKDLESTRLADEDFIQAVRSWSESPEAAAASRGDELENALKQADK